MNGVYKTNIDCSYIRGMVENYCTLSKIQPWPTIHLSPRPRLNFTSGIIIFHHSPHEQSIFVYYMHLKQTWKYRKKKNKVYKFTNLLTE